MRRNFLNLTDIKNRILSIKGKNIGISINRGRKKIDTFSAIVDNIYPSVFTVKVDAHKQQKCQTFSYFDVLCGDVVIR